MPSASPRNHHGLSTRKEIQAKFGMSKGEGRAEPDTQTSGNKIFFLFLQSHMKVGKDGQVWRGSRREPAQ